MNVKAVAFCVTAAGVAIVTLSGSLWLQRAHAAPPAWTPYQITYKTYNQLTGSGSAILTGEMTRAVRSDGSFAEASTVYNPNRSINSQVRLLKLHGGVQILMSEPLRLMTATRDPLQGEAWARQRLDPARSCAVTMEGGTRAQSVVSGPEPLFGYETYKVAVAWPATRTTSWYAPALGCAELRNLGERLDPRTGQVTQTADRTAVSIRAGEPDEALFDPPNGYRNVSPTDLAVAEAARCCRTHVNEQQVRAMPALQAADARFAQTHMN